MIFNRTFSSGIAARALPGATVNWRSMLKLGTPDGDGRASDRRQRGQP
jgi:hypothetical protein